MANYDINDPYDLDIMRADFDAYSVEEWDEYIELAKEKKLGFKNIGALMDAKKKAGISKYFGDRMIRWVLNLVEQLDQSAEDDEKDEKTSELLQDNSYKIPLKHLTLRVAWHDNKWNGTICKDPENNTYCNGFHSLLSERIRKRKDENIDDEIVNRGKLLKNIDYLPPCFWSANLFGKDPIKAKHDNPAAPGLKNIEEELPARSMYSWPFSVSFTRSKKEQKESGAYPKNLEETRIPRFNAKIDEGKSIAFMYAKFSNPITEEEQQYLVVGAGLVNRKQKSSEIPHFGPEKEIEKIKSRPQKNFKYRNFPSINWAMQFSFEEYSTIRMPYHEYLEEADKLNTEDRDGFMDKIKVAISEPELEWCFKYVAMDIGDDETIYVLTKMRKALISCKDDGVLPRKDMQERVDKVEQLLHHAWETRSYFPGFTSISRVLLNKTNEPKFPLEQFYEDFKLEENKDEEALIAILKKPSSKSWAIKYKNGINELKDRLEQRDYSFEQFLSLCMLNLKPFQFERVLQGKLKLTKDWYRDFDEVKRSHSVLDIIENPYELYEDYDYYPDSHDDVYGEELDAPIDLFKIDIAYFPDTRFVPRTDLQRSINFVDKRRIRALILRHLKTLENTGDCFTTAELLQKAITNYPLYYEIGEDYMLPENFFYPLEADYANHFQEEPKKIVLLEENDTMYYYLSEVYDAEKYVEKSVSELLRGSKNNEKYLNLSNYIHKSFITLKNVIGEKFDEDLFKKERQQLYTNIFKERLFIVAGSAGSGKSFEVLKIIQHLNEQENQKYLLLAPTGKAALRLSSDKDFENIQAFTIDKFINDVKNRKIKQQDIKAFKNVIVDETSMVDLLKFKRLLEIFNFDDPSFKRLILVGDPNQLPAIGYGRVLADLLNYLSTNKDYQNNFIQLESNCRSELKKNEVLRLAEAFKVNVKDDIHFDLKTKFDNKNTEISEGFRARYWSNKDELFKSLTEEFDRLTQDYEGDLNERLNQILGLNKNGSIKNNDIDIENFQILSPYHSEYSGASKINDFIQSRFKNDLKYDLRKNLFKESDKLLRTKNYYNKKKLELSNGTLGLIKADKGEKFYYKTGQSLDSMSFNDIRSSEIEFFELAYAITIHKSQGSGFNHLFLVIPSRFGLLSKELIYTALTRTKKSITLFIQSSSDEKKSVLERASERSFSASRKTSLLLDKPYRFYDLEPESGIYVESRVELLIYHILMNKRDELGEEKFNFDYEVKPIVEGKEVNIKVDFTIYTKNETWYWEHLGLLSQRKYVWTWKELKTKRYQEAGIWDQVITTDERNGISPSKIETIVELIIKNRVDTEDKYDQYSKHHFYLR
ncbi:AAA family ATPase [Psychroflexus sp. CAK1W]|uniref:ATP-dependent DNA helicase n=1 Tax=Psychroflexus curvus TaxID=2873595 RepID=UPI001CCC13EE|nr:AAA family ATPase [Psychroflexus curvus]MBZ9628160.1 AAA family ATPase [Psychroflexus curvus]